MCAVQIELKLVMDTGLRSYDDLQRALIHELAHNDITPHNDAFDALNDQLMAEKRAFESQAGQGQAAPQHSRNGARHDQPATATRTTLPARRSTRWRKT